MRDLATLASRLRQSALSSGHRLTLVLAGDADWGVAAARACLGAAGGGALWLSDRPLAPECLPLSAGTRILGSEVENLVYDAQGGFDPDGFGAAVGALSGGGLLLMLTPPLCDWPRLTDPQAARVAVEPFGAAHVGGRFIARLARVLLTDAGAVVARQGRGLPTPPPEAAEGGPAAAGVDGEDACRTPDQRRAVEAVLATARGRARRPLVITSDRGRGKSAALGIAAARLLQRGCGRILVTAPRRSAVDPVFRHAAGLLPGACIRTNEILLGDGVLEFLPPDEVAADPQPAGLLLVDEAAGIPVPLLERLLRERHRVVFATTVHGYEGTGRGFQVRFRRHLERLSASHRSLELSTPIRWAPGDPLEALVARALLLDARPAADAALRGAATATCRYEVADRDRLGRREQTLSELFGLLVLAHYQTRPLDLRHLLDGPNLEVHLLRHRGRVAATALVAREGGFAPELASQVYDGSRRPRGHLLPQTLCAHAGLADAPLLRWARVVRIAVHPAARGRGLGKMLLRRIADEARRAGIDCAGASFGAAPGLLRFWRRCGFSPVHLGTSRNASSGAHAAVVLCPLTEAGEDLASSARARLARRLPALLAGPMRDLEPAIAAALLAAGEPGHGRAIAADDRRELGAFAFSRRPFEAALPAIDALLRRHLPRALRDARLGTRESDLLIAAVLQHRGWAEVSRLACASGRGEVIDRLRRAVGILLRAIEGERSGRT
jgi:tRNA(Met) cytidine acetyltransferase